MKNIAELENMILCYQHQEKEYIDFIEGLLDENSRLRIQNKKLKTEVEEMLKSKMDLRKMYERKINNG